MASSTSQVLVAASVGGAAGAASKEPDPKRRRLLDAGGPVEDEETARQKMRNANVGEQGGRRTGFDADNILDNRKYVQVGARNYYPITPMGYFARNGDLPMMRWLFVNGADTRDQAIEVWFPMYGAAVYDHEEAVKWLFTHGASNDSTRKGGYSRNHSPFQSLFRKGTHRDLTRWMILNGALCLDESGVLHYDKVVEHLSLSSSFSSSLASWDRKCFLKERRLLLEWANNVHETHTSILTFLKGTLAHEEKPGRSSSGSSLLLLGGKSEILKQISEYVGGFVPHRGFGIIHGREARSIRHLTKLLPSLNRRLERLDAKQASRYEEYFK